MNFNSKLSDHHLKLQRHYFDQGNHWVHDIFSGIWTSWAVSVSVKTLCGSLFWFCLGFPETFLLVFFLLTLHHVVSSLVESLTTTWNTRTLLLLRFFTLWNSRKSLCFSSLPSIHPHFLFSVPQRFLPPLVFLALIAILWFPLKLFITHFSICASSGPDRAGVMLPYFSPLQTQHDLKQG